MAVKYNAVLTAGALARRADVRSNKYTTRLHVLVAALHKLAHRARLSMCTPLTRLEFAEHTRLLQAGAAKRFHLLPRQSFYFCTSKASKGGSLDDGRVGLL